MMTTRPMPPLGAYPQLLLCGHAGMAPNSIKIKITKTIVPNMFVSFFKLTTED